MSWGTELWDQFDNITSHTHKGIEFCLRYTNFIKDRCEIENEYAAKLKKLIKNYQPKKKEEEDYAFTCSQGFLNMINELHDMAGQHEMITENLNTNVLKELATFTHELKQERKKYLQENARQQSSLQAQLLQLEKTKRQYEKSFKDSEKAIDAYKKADADQHLSRAEVEKAKNLMHSRQQHSEECKKEYALELQKTNECQQMHYQTNLPQILQNLEDLDEKRVTTIQQLINQSASIERNVLPILSTCIDGMQKASQSIDPQKDKQMVIDRYKSGFQPPVDIPFEDLSDGNYTDSNSNANTPKSLRAETVKATLSGQGRGKKRGGLLGLFSSSKMDDTKEDYSHLPPTQQKKKLGQKIDTLRQAVSKDTAERDGMLKMRDVYIQNPALGDAATLDKQLEDNAQQLDKLKQELHKFETYLATCDNRNQDDSSMNRKMSEVSVGGPPPSAITTAPMTTIGDVPTSPHLADQDSFEELDEFPVIGTCTVLYSFEASNDGSINIIQNEELLIVEADQGDGWTRVRRESSGDEGFVPSTYIQTAFYENV